jgi:hypothetical protein
MCIERNTEVRTATIVVLEKQLSIPYSESVFVALVIQPAIRMRHIIICGLFVSTILFHITSQTTRLSEKIVENRMRVLNFSTNFV